MSNEPKHVYTCLYIQGTLQELQVELNSTDLLPGDRLSEVGAMVTELESQADSNEVVLEALQDQV